MTNLEKAEKYIKEKDISLVEKEFSCYWIIDKIKDFACWLDSQQENKKEITGTYLDALPLKEKIKELEVVATITEEDMKKSPVYYLGYVMEKTILKLNEIIRHLNNEK